MNRQNVIIAVLHFSPINEILNVLVTCLILGLLILGLWWRQITAAEACRRGGCLLHGNRKQREVRDPRDNICRSTSTDLLSPARSYLVKFMQHLKTELVGD